VSKSQMFSPAEPWQMPNVTECQFYHCMDFPDGETVTGPWDIRGQFEQYIGNYPIAGKSVLDAGTASGFLAFSAEHAKATVTTLELKSVAELSLLPFQRHTYFQGDRAAWEDAVDADWKNIKNSFWYAWHKYKSSVEMIYVPLREVKYWDRKFDVVTAGAILEHLSDPVTAIGDLSRLAKEAVIIAFTPVSEESDLLMRTANDWSNVEHYYTWWIISLGLYKRVFDNLGFDIELLPAHAKHNGIRTSRHTIIARRRI
jgi:hypothetical protein